MCGKTVTTDKAKPSVYAGNVLYFCSRECREVFEAVREFYVGSGDADQRYGRLQPDIRPGDSDDVQRHYPGH